MSTYPASSFFALGLLASCFGSRPAVAATAVASFSVTATVQASCLASLRPDHAATISATSAVSVTCAHPVSYDVSVTTERSARPLLVLTEPWVPEPAVARSAQRPSLANSLNSHPVSTDTAIDIENGSAQVPDLQGRTAGWRSWASPANVGLIVVTVTY